MPIRAVTNNGNRFSKFKQGYGRAGSGYSGASKKSDELYLVVRINKCTAFPNLCVDPSPKKHFVSAISELKPWRWRLFCPGNLRLPVSEQSYINRRVEGKITMNPQKELTNVKPVSLVRHGWLVGLTALATGESAKQAIASGTSTRRRLRR